MPTVHLEKGFRFFFYSNEHLPKHIHVAGKGGELKVDLESLTLMYSYNVKKQDLNAILEIVEQNRFYFLRKWDEFHVNENS
ncbi:DUF4160 domain-containing protein [Salinimicrobium sp. CAU 1759]